MHSMSTVTTMLDTVIKASRAADSATDTLSNVTSQIIPFFNALHKEVEEMEKCLEDTNATLHEKERTIVDLENKITEYKNTIAQNEEILTKYRTDSEKGYRRVYEQSATIDELRNSINEKDAHIAKLQQQITELRARMSDTDHTPRKNTVKREKTK